MVYVCPARAFGIQCLKQEFRFLDSEESHIYSDLILAFREVATTVWEAVRHYHYTGERFRGWFGS